MPPDEIDHLFRQYFQKELPSTWPEVVVEPTTTPRRSSRATWAPRLALFGSLACVLILGLTTMPALGIRGGSTPGGADPFANGQANGERVKSIINRTMPSNR
jgi:hypothetical protein